MSSSAAPSICAAIPVVKPAENKVSRFRNPIVPEKFDGSTQLSLFLSQFNLCAAYNGWDAGDKAAHLQDCLKGNAARVIKDGSDTGATFDEIVMRLKRRYGTDGQASLYRIQLRNRRRGQSESLQALYDDIRRLSMLAYPGPSSEHRDVLEVDAFVGALNDAHLELLVREKDPVNL